MAKPYTMGIWSVQEGREDEFVAAWSEFADWSAEQAPGAGWVRLLRDRANPQRFITVGPWDSLEAIEAWRALPGWGERVGRIRELLSGFEAVTLDAVIERD